MKKTLVMLFFASAFAVAQGYKVGDRVSNFTLKNVDGKMVSLSDYQTSKGVIVIFTCNTCPYAQAYEQRIIDLDKKFKSTGYPVVAINPNDPDRQPGDSFEAMVERAKKFGYSFPYVQDESQAVSTAFGASRTPHVYLLERKGNVFEVAYIGAIDDNTENAAAAKNRFVESAIQALDSGKRPDVTSTKAIGCTIKWKKTS